MYARHFGLRERPFELTPNPRYLFLTPHHREALAAIQYAVASRRGIAVLIGEAGTGKTTIVHAALQGRAAAAVVHLNNPTLTRAEFIEYLARAFSLSAEARTSKAAFLFEITRALEARRARDEMTAVIVDEAHSLPLELLEEVRLLANIETTTDKLLPVVLAGQPELADVLNRPELRQLKQRVAVRAHLSALSARETEAYVTGRTKIAGGRAGLFTAEALAEIHLRSRGIPRTISVICDNALVTAFAAGAPQVDRTIVLEVCDEFDLQAADAPIRPVARFA